MSVGHLVDKDRREEVQDSKGGEDEEGEEERPGKDQIIHVLGLLPSGTSNLRHPAVACHHLHVQSNVGAPGVT